MCKLWSRSLQSPSLRRGYKTYCSIIMPTNSIENEGPLEDQNTFSNLLESYLYLNFKILTEDGTSPANPGNAKLIADASNGFSLNYFAAAMFKSAEVYISSKKGS